MVMLLFGAAQPVYAQKQDSIAIPPKPTLEEIMKDWGPNDSLVVAAIWYGSNYDDFKMLSYNEEENIWLSNLSLTELAKFKAEWARLRNAVYVTYPYAKTAGATINEIKQQLENVDDRKNRKSIIKSKEKQLKEEFGDKIKNLSVYQGEILMKLINRETGNDCYDILEEYKGWFNTKIYQTVALFYGGNLKQPYNMKNKQDRQIEIFVREINSTWYDNPFRR